MAGRSLVKSASRVECTHEMFYRHAIVRDARKEYVVVMIGRCLDVVLMSLSDRRSQSRQMSALVLRRHS